MPRFKERHREQSLMVAVHLADQLQPGTFEHALDHVIDHRLDLSAFAGRYHNDATGAPAWNPAVLLKIILFGYSRGIVSSRALARACAENVVFMALADDARPHFTTIADFIASMEKEVQVVFQEILLVCSELDLIGLEFLGVDGRKLSSNAAKEWSGTHRQLEKKKAKIRAVVENLTSRHRADDQAGNEAEARRVERLEHKIERIERFLATHQPRKGQRGREIQSNKDCAACPLRANCLKSEQVKRRQLSIVLGRANSDAIRRMRERIDTPEGRALYSKRMAIAEPPFANITYNKGLNRLTLRGKVKATIQWMLFALVHNIEKISRANYIVPAYAT